MFTRKKCLTIKIIPKDLIQREKNKHAPSGYLWFTNFSFDKIKSKLDCYRGKNYMERLCKDLRKHVMKIINYVKKEMIPLTDKETDSYENQKVCHICKKELIVLIKMIKMHLNYNIKSEIIVITLENLEELLIIFAI